MSQRPPGRASACQAVSSRLLNQQQRRREQWSKLLQLARRTHRARNKTTI